MPCQSYAAHTYILEFLNASPFQRRMLCCTLSFRIFRIEPERCDRGKVSFENAVGVFARKFVDDFVGGEIGLRVGERSAAFCRFESFVHEERRAAVCLRRRKLFQHPAVLYFRFDSGERRFVFDFRAERCDCFGVAFIDYSGTAGVGECDDARLHCIRCAVRMYGDIR